MDRGANRGTVRGAVEPEISRLLQLSPRAVAAHDARRGNPGCFLGHGCAGRETVRVSPGRGGGAVRTDRGTCPELRTARPGGRARRVADDLLPGAKLRAADDRDGVEPALSGAGYLADGLAAGGRDRPRARDAGGVRGGLSPLPPAGSRPQRKNGYVRLVARQAAGAAVFVRSDLWRGVRRVRHSADGLGRARRTGSLGRCVAGGPRSARCAPAVVCRRVYLSRLPGHAAGYAGAGTAFHERRGRLRGWPRRGGIGRLSRFAVTAARAASSRARRRTRRCGPPARSARSAWYSRARRGSGGDSVRQTARARAGQADSRPRNVRGVGRQRGALPRGAAGAARSPLAQRSGARARRVAAV